MNLGILGTGMIANIMVPEFQRCDAFRCAAVFSRTAEKGSALAAKFHIPKVYTALEDLLADPEIDMVYVASPNSVHYSQTRAALLAGKHVICEKPFTPTLAEARELAELARERQLLLFEAITTAHHPNYGRIRQQLPALGPVKMVLASFCQFSSRYPALLEGRVAPAFDPACCGGALMDLNLYNIHFVVGLFGPPAGIHYYPNRHKNGVDTSGLLVLEYPGFVCQCAAAKDSALSNSIQIAGEAGYIRMPSAGSNCQQVELHLRGREPEITAYPENPWHYEVQDLGRLIRNRDYDTCYALLDTTLQVVDVLEKARRDAGLPY